MMSGSYLLLLLTLCVYTHASDNQLHNRLYKEIIKQDVYKNTIFSPFSIQLCIGLAHLGSRGTTADEIAQVIGYTSQFTTKNVSHALERLNEQSVLQFGNKVYVKSGYKLKPEYQNSVKDDLKSGVESINFVENVAAAKTINDWIEQQTNHKIKDVVRSDQLGVDSRMVLINAVYFKAHWVHKFSTPFIDKFTNEDGTTSDVQMMRKESHFKVIYHDESLSHVVKLPYADTNIAMYLVIPDATVGSETTEQFLNKLNFHEINKRMTVKRIELFMPRFKFETEVPLNGILQKLGIKQAFDSRSADFSGMTDESIYISDSIHKAFINVNENGTEATGVTALYAVAIADFPIEMTLKANRPFLFAIVSEDYDIPLFMGCVKQLKE